MDCATFEYSNHAVAQMFKRSISADDVELAITMGAVIKSYPNDKPFPSSLILSFVENARPLHVVVSKDVQSGICYIITAYEPDPGLWTPDFTNKY